MSLNYLFALYAATIIVTRVALWFWPVHSPKIGNFQTHHYMHGLVLMAVSVFITGILGGVLLAVGLALFVDELPLFFIYKGFDWPVNHWNEYHGMRALAAIVVISLAGYVTLLSF